ncbi:MAG: ASKHA domain-containing protein [Oscillospiraceae bacterium]
MDKQIHCEKIRSEYSSEVAAAVEITRYSVSIVLYDVRLSRRIGRVVAYGFAVTAENVLEELCGLMLRALGSIGVRASCVNSVAIAAPVFAAYQLEETLTAAALMLPPEAEIYIIPPISLKFDGRFVAALAAAPIQDGVLAMLLDESIRAGYYRDGELLCFSAELSGAFTGEALESGMPAESGAIDEVYRESDGTICYSVMCDSESIGIAPSGALAAASLMLSRGALDSDGIMTDRDLFYIGEDFYISQSDIRAIQSDKAKLAAALELISSTAGAPDELYLSGELFAAHGAEHLEKLGGISGGACVHTARNTVEQGLINLLTEEGAWEKLNDKMCRFKDITDEISANLDDLYIKKLAF